MRALLAAYALFSIGAGVLLFYLPLHLFSLGGSLFDVALLITIPAVVSILFSGVWGRLSDVMRTRKGFIIIGMVSISAFMFLLTTAMLQSTTGVLLALAAFTILTCATEPAVQAYATSYSPSAKKGEAAGRVNASNYSGIAASALVGGFVYDLFGFDAVALLAAAAGMAGAALMFGVREDKWPLLRRTRQPAVAARVSAPINVLGTLFTLYVFMFIFMVGGSAFGPLASVYLVQLGNSRTVYGIFTFLSFMVGGLVSTRIGSLADRFGGRKMLLLAALAYVVQFALVYYVKEPLPALIAWSFPIYLIGWIAAMSVVAESTPPSGRGFGMGLLTSSKNVGMVAGSLAGGGLAVTGGAGIGNVLVFSASANALGALFVAAFMLKNAVKP